ncbi:hypothetical protein B0187_06710 [Haemophilus paracuniculus]|uniref:Uncharacterized protein n=1 Tax=Haemophilus paracuniculus TaxID=734 RepID=A0A1T0ARH1_9PAST|nr:hypothetical protein [Haemophilus paracuniculus]OOR98947.1 hypothetical protein B0187_06710 [Haemophilus paracuniculus]
MVRIVPFLFEFVSNPLKSKGLRKKNLQKSDDENYEFDLNQTNRTGRHFSIFILWVTAKMALV